MARIFCIGSTNADFVYRVPHLPRPGETLAAQSLQRMLGGKGANQAIAAALSGAAVSHVGAVGPDGAWLVEALRQKGVDVADMIQVSGPTGQAIITVDDAGENAIVLLSGANLTLTEAQVRSALSKAAPGDLCLLQNEVNISPFAAQLAKEAGLIVIYSAAPFDADAVRAVLPYADLLVMNAVEAAQLQAVMGQAPDALGPDVLITRGKDGADYLGTVQTHGPAFAVVPVDTTGAGDCYIGAFAARRAAGDPVAAAMRWAAAAAAIKVTRPGTAEAMPAATEIAAFLRKRA